MGQGHGLDGYLHDSISYQEKPPQSQLQHMVGQFRGEYLARLGCVAVIVEQSFSDGDRIASNWLYTFEANSSTDSLRTAIHRKYDKLDVSQKVGVVHLYLTLCEMFQMS